MSQERIREDMSFVKEQIDNVLQLPFPESVAALVQIADMDYVRVLAEGDNELEIVELMVKIHRFEEKQGVTRTVLTGVSSLKELLDRYYKTLFYLQRIWFELEEEYGRELIRYATGEQITPYAVYLILQHSRIADKDKVWNKVMQMWEQTNE